MTKLNQRIIALIEGITDLLEKRNPFVSQDFIRLALDAMNFSDLAKHLSLLEQEERKEAEFDWIWKED